MFFVFASFAIVSLTSFINNADYSSDLIIFIISSISSFEIISVVIPNPNIFLLIAASVGDAAVVNPNGIKTLLANGLRTFAIKGNPGFSTKPKSITENPPNYSTLCKWVFDNSILAEELFPKALQNLETCALVNNNLCKNYSYH